jgi:3-hydroxyisobutyrate dehydrogenase-like beta-hydroxyacid dehydrogenase
MKERITFIGLGNMGQAMATNLQLAGYPLTVYNRTLGKTSALQERGARVADSPADAAQDADVVFTMVTDDEALLELTTGPDGLLDTLPSGALHVSCSTVMPSTNRRLAKAHAERNSQLVAAPVFGKPIAAATAQLWVCVSGPSEAQTRLAPLLLPLSQGSFDVGQDVGAANVVKLCGNFMLGAAIEAMAEAFTLAEKSGVDRQLIYEVLTSTLFYSPAYRTYGQMIATQDYKPAGATPKLLQKDLQLVLNEARAHKVPMPVANIVLDHLTATVEQQQAPDEDWTSFARRISEGVGVASSSGR